MDHGKGRFTLFKRDWTLAQWKEITRKSQQISEPQNGAWTTTYLENHDQARSVTRYASDKPEHRIIASKMLASYLLTLTGTPIIYEGGEYRPRITLRVEVSLIWLASARHRGDWND